PVVSLIIGVDFGTSASGFAYCKLGGGDAPRVVTHERWPDQPVPYAKTRTAVLYQGSRLEAWGWSAWKRWGEMSEGVRRAGSYSYLESFKLLLAEGGEPVDTVCPLPPGLTATQVVTDFLSALRSYIVKVLRRSAAITLQPGRTVWCLTLPAMWSDAAKAANRAGLSHAQDPASLVLTLEPEAAMLSAALPSQAPNAGLFTVGVPAVLPGGNPSLLADGDVVLVLDCGGGTVDATLHRVRGSGERLKLEEAAVTRGLLAGGRCVDAAAWAFIRQAVGAAQWDKWKAHNPVEWLVLMGNWEAVKRSFGGVPSKTSILARMARSELRVVLPPGLVQAIGPMRLAELSPAVAGNIRTCITPEGLLVLPGQAVAAEIFGPVVDQIVALAWELLEEGAGLDNSCNKVLLAGGFASSPYLQRRVKEALDMQAVLTPREPGAAIVTGAVLFGRQPTRLSARRCRCSYGVGTSRPWTSEDAVSNAAFEGVFTRLVKRAELVAVGQVAKKKCAPVLRSQAAIMFTLYDTPSNEARYTGEPDMRQLAHIKLELPKDWASTVSDPEDYPLEVEVRFGATELSLVARDMKTGDAVATTITWFGDVE
ncbi:Heat shock protein 12A, partial [Tetrabaena socialis]